MLTRLHSKLLKVSGRDAPEFLNGLLSAKMTTSPEAKNKHTVSPKDGIKLQSESSLKTVGNYGLIHESSHIEWGDADAIKFKQGIRRDGSFSHLFKSNGRVLTDLFIYPTPFTNDGDGTPTYLLEPTMPSVIPQLMLMFKFHKFKSDVEISPVDASVWHLRDHTQIGQKRFDHISQSYFDNSKSKSVNDAISLANKFIASGDLVKPQTELLGFALDSRNDAFGYRLVTKSNEPPLFNDQLKIKPSTMDEYILDRFKNGIVEIGDIPKGKSALPFEMNVDLQEGICLDKGCYQGQELVLRTWTRNAITKRIFPIHLSSNLTAENDEASSWVVKDSKFQQGARKFAASPFGEKAIKKAAASETADKDPNVIGKLLIAKGDIAMASIKSEFFELGMDQKEVILSNGTLNIKGFIDGTVW
ncbi:Iba57 protein [Martiniozyma asiatica (nom. inval.)]|nr:Iba57 protein [Martiniozyma asiatica]